MLRACVVDSVKDYAALSYCWGVKKQKYRRKQRTVDKPIPWGKLERTIQDAIRTTHSLGLRYLWADSLCIIQDDPDDTKQTLPTLRHIFENAEVTIIVEGSFCVDSGFLEVQKVPNSLDLPFFDPEDPDTKKSISLLPLEKGPPKREGTNLRAWCFEEFLLSRRRLIYGSHELRWACLEEENKTIHPSSINSSPVARRSSQPSAINFTAARQNYMGAVCHRTHFEAFEQAKGQGQCYFRYW